MRWTPSLLSDASLFLSSETDSDSELADIDVSDSENRTPRATTKVYHGLTSGRKGLYDRPSASPSTSLSSPSHSPLSAASDRPRVRLVAASLRGISENSLSIVYRFLSFDDVVQMSKTCGALRGLSFKLLPRLTIRCKSLFGVGGAQLERLIGRCSFYLKHLDLSHVAAAVTDRTVDVGGGGVTSASFHGCGQLTDSAVDTFLVRCPWIRELDLSGCHQLTAAIAKPLSMCSKLESVNLSWCSQIDSNIVPYLLFLNERHSLRKVKLHGTNRWISLFMAFEECFEVLERGRSKPHRLRHSLTVTGGLQSKYMNEEALADHVGFLQSRNVLFVDPIAVDLRSISEFDFKRKVDLLCKSSTLFSWRWYTVHSSDKVYLVMHTELGVFGTKLLPLLDFTSPRNQFISEMVESRRDPIEFLKSDCGLTEWQWVEDFQSKRCLSLLGMEKCANWIKLTVDKWCRPENVCHRDPRRKRSLPLHVYHL